MVDKEIINWIPYKEGQVYIFESDQGKQDTLEILDLERFNNPEDHLAIISAYHEKLIITARVPDSFRNPMGSQFHSSKQPIIVVDANTNTTSIEVNFKPYDYFFMTKINSIEDFEQLRIVQENNNTNLYSLECTDTTFCKKANAISHLLWSKTHGIVEYRLGNETWKLLKE